MNARITASQLYSYLTCPHRVVMDAVGDPADRDATSPFVQLLWERGTAHERDMMANLGKPFLDLSALKGDEKEAATREAILRREPLIYSGRLSAHELLGEPDLLRLENGGYVAIDIKSGAGREGADQEGGGKLRKEYGVQLALYTDILIRMGLAAGRFGYIWDVHWEQTRYELDIPLGPRSASLWEIYLRTRAAMLATLDSPLDSRPALCGECKQCVWRSACFRALRQTCDLTLLPELGRSKRDALAAEFPTLTDLAAASAAQYIHGERTDFPGIGAQTLMKFQRRAALQLAAAQPYLTQPVAWPGAATQLFFDIETDPMRDFCYLHGFVIREHGQPGGERFEGIFAADLSRQAERDAFAAAMALLRHYSTAVVVHYSRYERTEYRKLARKYPDVAAPEEIETLFALPRAFDLYSDVVRPGSEWPTHDFSIKSLAKHCGFSWRDSDPSGASSIEWFDQWAKTGNPRLRQRLLDYNEDDCRAMRVVWDSMRRFPCGWMDRQVCGGILALMPQILIVEDEVAIADALLFALTSEGFSAQRVALGGEALTALRSGGVDLAILDVGLPDMTGFEVCKQLRQFSAVPVMFLTARASEIDRVVGLEIGADDYVVKPFSPREVVARVRAILKRSSPGSPPASRPGEFHVDHDRLQIHFCNRVLKLTALEFRLLLQLVGAPGRVHSREQLLAGVGMPADVGYERNIDSHIKALRAKLREIAPEREPIQTHRGFGYSYQPAPSDTP